MGMVNLDAENERAAARTIGSWSTWEHEPAAMPVKTANLCVLSTPELLVDKPGKNPILGLLSHSR
jgi:hypothetical protein